MHRRARDGQAGARRGPALGIAALGSFAAGTFAIVALMRVRRRSRVSQSRSVRPSIFSLMVLGPTILSFLSQGSMAKSLLRAAFGSFWD